jgi:hypothetical protein
MILDVNHRPVFYLKHHVSETEFYLCLQAELTEVGSFDRAGLSPDTSNDTNRVYEAGVQR